MATAIAFTVPVRQASPLYVSRRDLTISGGDDIVLQLTVKETDGGSAVNVSGAVTTLRIARPGGAEVYSKSGVVIDAATGRINITLENPETYWMAGAYEWQATVALSDRTFATMRGTLNVHGLTGEGIGGDYLLLEPGDYLLLE